MTEQFVKNALDAIISENADTAAACESEQKPTAPTRRQPACNPECCDSAKGSSKLEQDGESKAASSISETAASESSNGSGSHTAGNGAENIRPEEVQEAPADTRPAEKRTQADYDEFTAIKRDLKQDWNAEGLLENEEINRLARCILRGRRTSAIYDSQIDHALTRLEHYQRLRLRTQQRAFMNQLFTAHEREPSGNGER